MNRRVLLLEPNYRNKYPPVGLMKLAMYHRLQGDDVVFYKGDLATFVLSQVVDEAVSKLFKVDASVDWRIYTSEIQKYIQYGKIITESDFEHAIQLPLVMRSLEYFKKYYRNKSYYDNPCWDRVCVTTLFTFYWDITIETIQFAKRICKDQSQVLVGGVLASVVPDKLEKETQIKPHEGCLNVEILNGDKPLRKPYKNITIDELPLDYSILDEIDYQYPAINAYYAYATRGCVNKCAFCAVPKIEPHYRDYIPLEEHIKYSSEHFGAQRDLLLLDNNIFASKQYDKIINEIHDLGFAKGATYVPPNQLDVAVRQLRAGWNNRASIRRAVRLINDFVDKLENDEHQRFYNLVRENKVRNAYTATEESICRVYEEIKDCYEAMRSKRPVVRYIDFNQGVDARLATPEKMAKLATVAIRPLRIAFDSWSLRKEYVKAVYLAQKNGIMQMSNYLLYNFHDKPVDLYERLLLNIDLCGELGVNIYSFPMKYHPVMDEAWFSNRDYIGPKWSRKAIRTIQSVLNSTHGKIGRGRTFFFKAFGRNVDEFNELIKMPEAFIIKRWDAELSGLTDKWRSAYEMLSEDERVVADRIIDQNIFNPSDWLNHSKPIQDVLKFYVLDRQSIPLARDVDKQRMITRFDDACSTESSTECKRLLSDARNKYG